VDMLHERPSVTVGEEVFLVQAGFTKRVVASLLRFSIPPKLYCALCQDPFSLVITLQSHYYLKVRPPPPGISESWSGRAGTGKWSPGERGECLTVPSSEQEGHKKFMTQIIGSQCTLGYQCSSK
jgi:hypothetical protein